MLKMIKKLPIFLSLFFLLGSHLLAQGYLDDVERSRKKPLFKHKRIKFTYDKKTNTAYYKSDILKHAIYIYIRQPRAPLEIIITDNPNRPPELTVRIFNASDYLFDLNKITFDAGPNRRYETMKIVSLPGGVRGDLYRDEWGGIAYIETWNETYTGKEATEMAKFLLELADWGYIKLEGKTRFDKSIGLVNKDDRAGIRLMGEAWLEHFADR